MKLNIIKNTLYKCEDPQEHITIPDGITEISSYAFRNCETIKSVILPKGLKSIGLSAFEGCSSLTNVSFPDSLTTIESHAFKGCSSFTSISLPNGITAIELGTFEDCSSLAMISLPANLEIIEGCAFEGCSSLANISFPDSLTTIEYSAFAGCASLTEISIPESVTVLERAFYECPSLNTITLTPENIKRLGWPITDKPLLDRYCTREGDFLRLGHCLIEYSGNAEELKIPDDIVCIADSCFMNNAVLKAISFPKNLYSIGSYAFSFCEKLKELHFPQSLSYIGASAFSDCTDLSVVSLPANLPQLEDDTFFNCPSLATLAIPKGLKTFVVPMCGFCVKQLVFQPGCRCEFYSGYNILESLECIVLPSSLEEDFDEHRGLLELLKKLPKNITLYTEPGSKSEKFARENNFTCRSIHDFSWDTIAELLPDDNIRDDDIEPPSKKHDLKKPAVQNTNEAFKKLSETVKVSADGSTFLINDQWSFSLPDGVSYKTEAKHDTHMSDFSLDSEIKTMVLTFDGCDFSVALNPHFDLRNTFYNAEEVRSDNRSETERRVIKDDGDLIVDLIKDSLLFFGAEIRIRVRAEGIVPFNFSGVIDSTRLTDTEWTNLWETTIKQKLIYIAESICKEIPVTENEHSEAEIKLQKLAQAVVETTDIPDPFKTYLYNIVTNIYGYGTLLAFAGWVEEVEEQFSEREYTIFIDALTSSEIIDAMGLDIETVAILFRMESLQEYIFDIYNEQVSDEQNHPDVEAYFRKITSASTKYDRLIKKAVRYLADQIGVNV